MSNMLIIGGSGFIGGATTRAAMAAGHDVTLLNRGSRAVEGTNLLAADRNEPGALDRALAGRSFDVVIDTTTYDANQARMLIRALGGRTPRAVVISTAAVYSEDAVQPANEDQPIGGSAIWGSYGSNKSRVEEVFAAEGGFEHCAMVRPVYVCGQGNIADRETWFWTRQLRGETVLLPGDGQTQVQFVHKDDVASAIMMLAESGRTGFEAFNVADPTMLTLSGLASMLAEVCGCEDRQFAVGDLAGDAPAISWFPFFDYPLIVSSDRLTKELGWRPARSLKERFAETLTGYSRDELRANYKPNEVETALRKAVTAAVSV